MPYKLNHWYKFLDFDGNYYIGQYIGRQKGFECCKCGKGCNAYTFNIWYDARSYETWGYGKEHLPKMIQDLGEHAGIITQHSFLLEEEK